jgi:hypothetical protein
MTRLSTKETPTRANKTALRSRHLRFRGELDMTTLSAVIVETRDQNSGEKHVVREPFGGTWAETGAQANPKGIGGAGLPRQALFYFISRRTTGTPASRVECGLEIATGLGEIFGRWARPIPGSSNLRVRRAPDRAN